MTLMNVRFDELKLILLHYKTENLLQKIKIIKLYLNVVVTTYIQF